MATASPPGGFHGDPGGAEERRRRRRGSEEERGRSRLSISEWEEPASSQPWSRSALSLSSDESESDTEEPWEGLLELRER